MRATIQYSDKAGQPFELPMQGDTLVIGREPGCELVLDDPGVSKRHAQIIRVENEYIIRDQGSVNGTFVGERKITHHTLRDGDVIKIAQYEMTFRLAPDGAPAGGQLAVIQAGQQQAGGLATVTEPAPFAQQGWLEEQVAAMGAQDQARKKTIGWILNGVIALGVVLLLLVIFAFRDSGPSATNLGTVTLEMGTPQIVYVPENPANAAFEAPPDLVEVSTDENDRGVLAELRATDLAFYFIKVVPSGTGAGSIIMRGEQDYVVSVIVDPKQKEEDPYAIDHAAAKSPDTPDDVKQTKARSWLDKAKNSVYERPYTALQWIDIAKEYAGNDMPAPLASDLQRIMIQILLARADAALTGAPRAGDFQTQAEQDLDAQWQQARLQYVQNANKGDVQKCDEILGDMKALVPDSRDLRRRWVDINQEAIRNADKGVSFQQLRKVVEDELEQQWQGLRLRYSQAAKRADLRARANVLRAMMALIPDPHDIRYQWAKANLDRTNYLIAHTRRTGMPWSL
jgi:hypothetical protein